MPTKRDNVKVRKSDGGATTHYENPDLAARLKAKGVKAEVGKPSGDKSKRMAKNKEYVSRQRDQKTAPKRKTTAAPATRSSGSIGGQRPVNSTFAPPPMPPRPIGQYGPVQGPMNQMGQMPSNRVSAFNPNPSRDYGVNPPIPQPPRSHGINPPMSGPPSAFSPDTMQLLDFMSSQPMGQQYINQFLQQNRRPQFGANEQQFLPMIMNQKWSRGW